MLKGDSEEELLTPNSGNEDNNNRYLPEGNKVKGLVFDSEIGGAGVGGNINLTVSRVEQSTVMDLSPVRQRD
jgi:hypothetical protein